MPLPTADQPWPPPDVRPVLEQVTRWDAWYGGDRDTLSAVYRRDRPDLDRPSLRARFWSRQREYGARDTRMHIPLPADIATMSADLLFAEPPTLTADVTATQDRLDEIADAAGWHNTWLEAAEIGAALGGVYLKADWSRQHAPWPILAVVHADAAVPEFAWGMLTAVTFWRELARTGPSVLRYLERHDPGRIEVGLYEGGDSNLGRAVPLDEHPDTADLADGLTEGNVKATGIERLTAAYVPNMRPNRGKLRGSAHGRSDYHGLEQAFDSLDETWSSWIRDLRLGKARLVIPRGYLQSQGRGQGATFDHEQELYAELDMPPTGKDGASAITMVQFGVRVDEHQRTADQLVRMALQTAGYSPQSLGLDDAGTAPATATEIDARERRSMTTRDRKSRYWRPALRHMAGVILDLDRALKFSTVPASTVAVEFGDGVSEDPQSIATTLELLQRAAAISTEMKVRMLHPDWDDTEVNAEVARIQDDSGANVADPAIIGAPEPPAPEPPVPADPGAGA